MASYVVVRIAAACVEECGVNLRCPTEIWIRRARRLSSSNDRHLRCDALDSCGMSEEYVGKTELVALVCVAVPKVPVGQAQLPNLYFAYTFLLQPIGCEARIVCVPFRRIEKPLVEVVVEGWRRSLCCTEQGCEKQYREDSDACH